MSAAASSDPDEGDVLSYAWDFGDGSNGSGVNVSHTWTQAGVFTVQLTVTDSRGLTSTTSSTVNVIDVLGLGSAKVWIGLKNSDAVGLRLDVRAEVLLNGVVVGSGEVLNVSAGSSGFNNALLHNVTLALASAKSVVDPGSVLTFRPSARRTCTGGGHNSGAVRFWYDGPAVDAGPTRNAGSRFSATIQSVTSDWFARSPNSLSTTSGTVRTLVDANVNSSVACPARPYTSLGDWSIILP